MMDGEIDDHPFRISFQSSSVHSGSISFGRFENEALSWERRSSFSHNKYLEEVKKCSKPGSVIEKKAYFEDHFKKKALLRQSVSESRSDIFNNVGLVDETEHDNAGTDYAHFDKSPDAMQYCGDNGVREYGREDPAALSFESQMEPSLDNIDDLVETVLRDVHPEEDVGELDANEYLGRNSGRIEESSKSIDTPNRRKEGDVNKTSFECRKNPSPKLIAAVAIKSTKPTLKSRVNAISRRTKIINHSSENATIHRTSKPEGSESTKLKLNHDNKSDKKIRPRKVVEPQTLTLKKAETKVENRACQPVNRIKGSAHSTMEDTRPSAATFNLKSNEREEKRKEFNMKLEEKVHAKEANINQVEARRQEKTKAEIKQLRKGLNFKATPMPSFCHVAVPPCSDANKAVPSISKPNKVRKKSKAPGCGNCSESILQSKVGGYKAFSYAETNCPTAKSFASGKISPTAQTNKNFYSEASTNAETSKITEVQKAEGKQKLGAQRSSNEMVRKEMKGIASSSSSRIRHLTVGVAS